MKTALLGLILAVLPVSGQMHGTSGSPLTLYTLFEQQPPAAVWSAIQEETAALMNPLGVATEWRSMATATGGEVSVELVAISFKGACNVNNLQLHSRDVGALGWAHISDNQILPFMDIECDRIRDFLQGQLLQVDGVRRETLFGRAIGRVLTHELYHILAQTRHHGGSGVAAPSFTVSELLGDHFSFDEREFRALRNSRAVLLLAQGLSPRPSVGRSLYLKSGCGVCHGMQHEGTPRGPLLRLTADLVKKMSRKGPAMSKQAKALKVPWQSLGEDEIRIIAEYLSAEY